MRKRVRYKGQVQGVGFRATAARVASGHAVTGWVRNEIDGSVTLEAQGDAGAVDGYLSDLSSTMNDYIRSAAVSEIAEEGEESAFLIRSEGL